jgi:hypothetical protein
LSGHYNVFANQGRKGWDEMHNPLGALGCASSSAKRDFNFSAERGDTWGEEEPIIMKEFSLLFTVY